MEGREIKFRYWDGEKIDYDPCMKVIGQKYCSLNSHFSKDMNPDNVDILMQYTGIKDQNKTEVYEGDVSEDFSTGERFVIEFVDGAFCLVDSEKIGHEILDLQHQHIIGNIYQNPELLKVVSDDV
jgi:uncharacterized phage protein (TIGR01671 family)